MSDPYVIFERIALSEQSYLSQWYLDAQMIITSKRYNELRKVQQQLYKAINYFIKHYRLYEHIFRISDPVRRILDVCKPYPYRPGTYRPDFLINRELGLKICEIGARFPLNGYFMSGIAEFIGRNRYKYKSYFGKPVYEYFLGYLLSYWGNIEVLYVLKGEDRPCDIKYYIPFFDQLGIKVKILTPPDMDGISFSSSKYGVLNEFNQMEIEALHDNVLRMIAASVSLNDMRTIFLIHDKRFLAVLSDPDFLTQCLSSEEIKFLQPYLIPTYTSIQSPEIWEKAKKEKDNWILKHCLLGKSEEIYMGSKCSEGEWLALFVPSVRDSMVLQPLIDQRQIASTIAGKQYHDFVVGTLLCFDDRFFGTGIFRTSSYEITNRIDDRKMASCFTDNYVDKVDYFIL